MPPPRTLLSTSRTRAINIPLALAGEAAQPHTAEEVVVEEVGGGPGFGPRRVGRVDDVRGPECKSCQ